VTGGRALTPGAKVDYSCCILVKGDLERGEVSGEARVRMRRCKLTPCSTTRVEIAIARSKWAIAKERVLVLGGCTGLRAAASHAGLGALREAFPRGLGKTHRFYNNALPLRCALYHICK
jgi:hypothetical protein